MNPYGDEQKNPYGDEERNPYGEENKSFEREEEESKAVPAEEEDERSPEELKELQEELLRKVEGVKYVGSAYLLVAEHARNWKVVNCRGSQDWHSKCNWKKGLSEEKAKSPCGCENALLLCAFVGYIDILQTKDAAHWQKMSGEQIPKYWVCTDSSCVNYKKLYLFSQIFQTNLSQMLASPHLLRHFALNPLPLLADDVY